jgi:hypothetical protein
LAYVVTSTGLHVIDVADAQHPVEQGSVRMLEGAGPITQADSAVLVAWNDGVAVLDASTTSHPSQIGFLNQPSGAFGAVPVVAGGYAYP